MFRTILVPLDGSTFGEHALPLALELAQKTGATLHLAHVLMPLSAVFADAPPFVAPSTEDQILEQQRATERSYLDTTARRLSEAGAPSVQTSLLSGDVPDVLSSQVSATGADLVVMATHGYGPFTRFWLGSVADELVRSLPIPLLLIRPGEEEADLDRPPPLNHILLPLDGSELAEQMVEPADCRRFGHRSRRHPAPRHQGDGACHGARGDRDLRAHGPGPGNADGVASG